MGSSASLDLRSPPELRAVGTVRRVDEFEGEHLARQLVAPLRRNHLRQVWGFRKATLDDNFCAAWIVNAPSTWRACISMIKAVEDVESESMGFSRAQRHPDGGCPADALTRRNVNWDALYVGVCHELRAAPKQRVFLSLPSRS